jgi:hypothetical protein
VDMWQYWWEDARDIQGQTGNDRNAASMYEVIVDSALRRGWTLGPELADMQALLKRVWKAGRLAYTTWPEYPGLLILPHNVSWRVLGSITKNSKWQKRLGSHFYDEETISAFWEVKNRLSEQATAAFAKGLTSDPATYMGTGVLDNMNENSDSPDDEELDEHTLHDLYGEVHLETYGRFLQSLDYGNWDLDIPQEQCCTICIEPLGAVGVKISACGHYFHFRCIQEWLNGTSPNGNLCPECRTQICAKRRKVRHVAVEDEGDEDGEGGVSDEEYENDFVDSWENNIDYDESALDSDESDLDSDGDDGEIFLMERAD